MFNDIKQKTNQDISNNQKYISIFKKLVQTIYKQNINKRVSTQHLNNLVIDKCVPFMINHINKDSIKPINNINRPINLSNRPMSSQNQPQNLISPNNNNFSNLTLGNGVNNNINKYIENVAGISSRNDEKID